MFFVDKKSSEELLAIIRDTFSMLNGREKRSLWLLAFADVFISVLDICFLLGLLFLVNYYSNTGAMADKWGIATHLKMFPPVTPLLLFFLLFCLKNFAGWWLSKQQYQFVFGIASRLSKRLLLLYLHGAYQDYINTDSSVVNRKISQEPIECCQYVLNGLQQIFSQLLLIAITLVAVVAFNPLLFPLLILLLAPPVLLVSWLIKKKLTNARINGKQTSEKAMQHLQEALNGFVESNLYTKHHFFTERYYKAQAKLNNYLSQRLAIQSMPNRLIEVFAVLGFVLLAAFNTLWGKGNPLELATLGALIIAAYKIIPGVVKITNLVSQVKTYASSAATMAASTRQILPVTATAGVLQSVSFKNVCFSYPNKPILRDFSFNLQRGDFICITGFSGKGKTTLVNLLLGFIEPASGSISINGAAINANDRKAFWPSIAYVKQQPFLLHAPIIENITLQEVDHNTDKLRMATAVAGLDPLLQSMPLQIKSVVTENGKNFSGGQRQRFVFARALYKEFDLLVLDEPFNEMDEQAEIDLLKQLQQICSKGKMIMLITHNKLALQYCTRQISMVQYG